MIGCSLYSTTLILFLLCINYILRSRDMSGAELALLYSIGLCSGMMDLVCFYRLFLVFFRDSIGVLVGVAV